MQTAVVCLFYLNALQEARLLSLIAWSILLIFTGTSHLIKTSKVWAYIVSLKRLDV